MADARDSRLRTSLAALDKLGVSRDAPSVEALERAWKADPETALAVADLGGDIASAESAALVARIEADARRDKLVRREARRSLYKLKQRGIQPPAEARSEAARSPLAAPEAEGFLSFSDPAGDRLLWIVKPRPGGGLFHLSVVVNEPAGLHEAVLAEVNRKGLKSLREELGERHGLRLVEVDWRYLDWIAAEGFERSRVHGAVGDSASRYPQLRMQLFTTAAKPFEGALQPLRGDAAAALAASKAPLAEPELAPWFLTERELGPYLARYREIRDSPILLDRSAQLARLEEIVASSLDELFAGERSQSWRRRLDEAAYFFAKTGRAEAADQTAAAAAAVAERATGRGIPFLEDLVRRSFGAFFAREVEREREEKATSVLVTPDDIRAEQARARNRPRF